MTREQQLEKLRAGESVFVQMGDGVRLVSREQDLPGEDELALASGDSKAVEVADADLDKQIAALQARKAKLKPEPAKADPPKPEVKPAPAKEQK